MNSKGVNLESPCSFEQIISPGLYYIFDLYGVISSSLNIVLPKTSPF